MPVLSNVRWEVFAGKLADGVVAPDAYVAAGYAANAKNAYNLAKKPQIMHRIQELKEIKRRDQVVSSDLPPIPVTGDRLTPAEVGITEVWLVRQLMLNVSQAQQAGKFKEANTAIEMLGNYFGGLFSSKNSADRSDNLKKDAEKNKSGDLTGLMQRMAEGFATDDKDEDEDAHPPTA